MKKKMVVIVLCIAIIASFAQPVLAATNNNVFSFKPYSFGDSIIRRYQQGKTTYEVVSYAPVRTDMYKHASTKDYLHTGAYILNGKEYVNKHGNTWVLYYDELGEECWVYIGHLQEHVHDYERACEGKSGNIDICDCGAIYIDMNTKPFSVDCGDNLLCQVFWGDFSNTSSYMSVSINYALSNEKLMGAASNAPYVGIAFRVAYVAVQIRDFVAAAYYGTNSCVYQYDKEACVREMTDIAWGAFGEVGLTNDATDFIYSYLTQIEEVYEENNRIPSYVGGFDPYADILTVEKEDTTCPLLDLP